MSGVDVRALMAEQDPSAEEPASGATLSIPKSCHITFATGASGETNALSNPDKPGLLVRLTCRSHGGGDRVITASTAINQTGNTIMTFGASRDTILLESIKISATALAWQVVGNDGVALS